MQSSEQPGMRWSEPVRASASLEQWTGTAMPVEEFLRLAIRVVGELAALHARGAIHEDIRPSSILFDAATGELALAGAPAGWRASTLSEGSLPYISPEQTGRMNQPIDSRSDLYSLGVVFYQLLAGRLPFEAEDAVGWVHCHVARQPRPLDQVRPSLPRSLIDIVGKLLAKLPDHRYQSALGLPPTSSGSRRSCTGATPSPRRCARRSSAPPSRGCRSWSWRRGTRASASHRWCARCSARSSSGAAG
ncbi:MAG: hypothetical protein E6J91_41110 [Deltaproteobacteria bacterium]|nr:MAG: hypothetical protein E6J91_41110 [Deltaproteobacteria bacterium]